MSNPIPSSLALTNIATGSPIISSTHDTNYSAIQTAVNEFVAALNSGVVNQFLQSAGGSAVQWAYQTGQEIASATLTTPTNITDTSEATATAIISSGSVTFDGSPVWAEVYIDAVNTPSVVSSFVVVSLFEGATQITRLATIATPAAVSMQVPVFAKYKFTPSAGAHTYKMTAFASTTTGTPQIIAGGGGTATAAPAVLRFVRA